MAMPAKLLMDEFYARAKAIKAQGDFVGGAVFDQAENMVNNFMHGRPFAEVANLTRAALMKNAAAERNDAGQRAAYTEAVHLLDTFVANRGA